MSSKEEHPPIRRWPAEWEPQSAIWLAWPHNEASWPGRFAAVPRAFAEFVRAIADVLPVRVLTPPRCHAVADREIGAHAAVELVECPTNDCWIRDYGPTFVLEGERLVGVDWRYNAWGGKYPPWDDDAAAAQQICALAGAVHEASPLTCEGGALETDGRGRLLTTPGCLLSETRNPGWTQQQVAEELHAKLAVTEILWLDGGGLDGDDTDGHIDQLARFVSPSDVVCAVCNDPHDANHHPLQQNYLQLRVWGRQTEPAVEIHRLPIPPRREIDGQPVPESYCNFLMVDRRRLLLPQFGDETSDRAAAELFAWLLPEWEIFPLDARVLVWGLGAFHCASQQQPAPQQLQLRGVPQANNAPRGGDPD